MEKLNKRDLYYLRKAYEISKLSDFPRVPIGCIAVYKKRIIGIGYNSLKTSPIQAKYNALSGRKLMANKGRINEYIHAEMDCLNMIRHMDVDFSKVRLYISRKNMLGEIGSCKPCEACEYAIKELGIKTVYYTDKINKYIREVYNDN